MPARLPAVATIRGSIHSEMCIAGYNVEIEPIAAKIENGPILPLSII